MGEEKDTYVSSSSPSSSGAASYSNSVIYHQHNAIRSVVESGLNEEYLILSKIRYITIIIASLLDVQATRQAGRRQLGD